jgi:hypothetical protein
MATKTASKVSTVSPPIAPDSSVLPQWNALAAPIAVAVDIGNSSTIGAVGDRHVLIPSALLAATHRTEIPTDDGSVLLHIEGDTPQSWLVGNMAIAAAPTSHEKVVSRTDGKIHYALPLVLSQLALLFPDTTEIAPAVLVVALPDAQVLGIKLREKLQGSHTVTANGRKIQIVIDRVEVIEEGRGALLHAVNQGAIAAQVVTHSTALVLDLGGGTTLISAAARGKFLPESRFVVQAGVYALWREIAQDSDPEMIRARTLEFGDPAAVARSFERGIDSLGRVEYLKTGIDLMGSYRRAFGPWLQSTVATALNQAKQWRDSAEVILVGGGGAMLPGLISALRQSEVGSKIVLCPQPRVANALGMAAHGQTLIGGR